MNQAKLRARLQGAQLVLGDIGKTIPFASIAAPVAFVSFDLDYYSSTMKAFQVFEQPSHTRLPRVFCYFDDVGEPDWAAYNEFAGELLAIDDFDESHELQKIAKMRYIAHQRAIPAT